MIVDELISLAGTVAALSVVVGVVTVILRGQRKGADSGRRRAAGIAQSCSSSASSWLGP